MAPVAPDPAAVPLAVPLPDSPHGASWPAARARPRRTPGRTVGRTAGRTVVAPAAGARRPAAAAEQFGPVTATAPGAPT